MLLIDEYDALAASRTAPLASLLPNLAAAGDSGLHVVMTGRVMGACRGMFVLPPGRAQLIRPGEPVEHVQTAYAARSEARAP